MAKQIHLYGTLGDTAAGLDAKTVTAAIRAASGDLSVYINSGGGLVFDGLPIYDALLAYDRGRVTVFINGVAASMASVVAMAGDDIIMSESALMMIHRPWDSAMGNPAELRAHATTLEKVEERLIAIYALKTGLEPSALAQLMADETWFDAAEALAKGFITGTSATLKMAAMADISACGFRHPPEILKGNTMSDNTPNAATTGPMNAAEIRQVNELVEAHRLPITVANDIFRQNMTMPQARAHILDNLAQHSDDLQIGHRPSIMNATNGVGGADTLDNPAFHAQAVSDVIYARLSGKAPKGAAGELANTSLVDLAREMLVRRGINNAFRMRPGDVLDAASWGNPRASGRVSPWLGSATSAPSAYHTTSDFPGLLLDASQRYLHDMYQGAESELKKVARERTARDFRAISALQLSGFGTLPSLNEGGEFKYGTVYERKESYALATYGKMFSISRQALVNDDLGAFTDMFRIMGRASAETEAAAMADLLNANPVMSDGNALFSTAHGNNISPGAAPGVASMDLVRQALRAQKDSDGVTLMNVQAKYLVVPSTLETSASVLAGASMWTPASSDAANPFAGAVTPLAEPRLTNTTAWYAFADPAMAPVLEYAHLDGVSGPQVEMREGWSSLGQEFRVYTHFGCGVTGSAGAVRNAGA